MKLICVFSRSWKKLEIISVTSSFEVLQKSVRSLQEDSNEFIRSLREVHKEFVGSYKKFVRSLWEGC